MATLKRTDSKAFGGEPPPPKRTCVACTEPEADDLILMRPCRICDSDYCESCLVYMFVAAGKDGLTMPPKCCAIIQLHVIRKLMAVKDVSEYKAKFEQWITPNKTFCPVRACSAFIPEKRVPEPAASLAQENSPTLSSVLDEILKQVSRCPSSRFFRGEMDIRELPGYSAVVEKPMDLSIIQDKIGKYKTIGELTVDVTLIQSNAVKYNGGSHPVSVAAADLLQTYHQEIFALTDRLIPMTPPPTPPSTLFACPKCHIAICTTCKQVEHSGSPCDTSDKDHEMAMLQQFGYKQCPRCSTAVKKMYGCSHMQCVCGAHWCWWCRQPLEKCQGGCDEMRGELEDEEDYDSEDDEVPESSADAPGVNKGNENPSANDQVANGAASNEQTAVPAPIGLTASQHLRASAINLDAGGGRVWDDDTYNFGAEPDDEPFAQVWSCHHDFQTHRAPVEDGINRGDFDHMECNRCFLPVSTQRLALSPIKPAAKKLRRKLLPLEGGRDRGPPIPAPATTDVSEKEPAWECLRCKLVVCVACREKYKAEPKQRY